jgi:hypothetical protein
MQQDLKARLEADGARAEADLKKAHAEHAAGVENARIRIALDRISASVTLVDTGGKIVYVNDHQQLSPNSYNFTPQSLGIGDPVTISYNSVGALILNGAQSGIYVISALADGMTVTINAGGGPNQFTVIPGVQGLTINGLGTGQLTIDDSADAGNATYTITASTVQINGLPPITYTGTPSLIVLGGSGMDTFNVQATAAETPIILNGGTGGSIFNVGSSQDGLNELLSAVNINGVTSVSNTLVVNDRATSIPETYSVTVQMISRPDFARINYANCTNVSLFAGNAGTVINVASTQAGTTTDIFGGSGNDEFVLYNGTLNDLLGPVNLHGGGGSGDFVIFDDLPNTIAATYTLTTNTFTRSGIAPVNLAAPLARVHRSALKPG